MPAHLVGFASDCVGNQFCFDVQEGDDVMLFDHDFGTVRTIAPGFTAWIDAFNRLRA